MKWWQRLRKGRQLEQQLDAELTFHLEGLVAEHMADGMPEDEARRRARLEFGGMDQVKEECRDARGTMWVEAAWQDTRLALRSLRKTPGFAAAAICTLALGIGANTAIFSVVYAVLLKPLPYTNPDELVAISSYIPQMEARFPSMPVRAVDFLEYRRTATAFAGLSALAPIELNLTGSGEPERLNGARVSANFFSTVGIAPERGRAFDEEEDQTGRDQVAIISHALWVRRLVRIRASSNRRSLSTANPTRLSGSCRQGSCFPPAGNCIRSWPLARAWMCGSRWRSRATTSPTKAAGTTA